MKFMVYLSNCEKSPVSTPPVKKKAHCIWRLMIYQTRCWRKCMTRWRAPCCALTQTHTLIESFAHFAQTEFTPVRPPARVLLPIRPAFYYLFPARVSAFRLHRCAHGESSACTARFSFVSSCSVHAIIFFVFRIYFAKKKTKTHPSVL